MPRSDRLPEPPKETSECQASVCGKLEKAGYPGSSTGLAAQLGSVTLARGPACSVPLLQPVCVYFVFTSPDFFTKFSFDFFSLCTSCLPFQR